MPCPDPGCWSFTNRNWHSVQTDRLNIPPAANKALQITTVIITEYLRLKLIEKNQER